MKTLHAQKISMAIVSYYDSMAVTVSLCTHGDHGQKLKLLLE